MSHFEEGPTPEQEVQHLAEQCATLLQEARDKDAEITQWKEEYLNASNDAAKFAGENNKLRAALGDLLAWSDQTKQEFPGVRTSRAIDRARNALKQSTMQHVDGCKAIFTKDDADCDLCGRL